MPARIPRLSFAAEPKNKQQQQESSKRLTDWILPEFGALNSLVLLRQIEEIVSLAKEQIHDHVLQEMENGTHKAFGAVVRIKEVIDKKLILETSDLREERQNRIRAVNRYFKQKEDEILSTISSPRMKRLASVYFLGEDKHQAPPQSKPKRTLPGLSKKAPFPIPEDDTCDFCGLPIVTPYREVFRHLVACNETCLSGLKGTHESGDWVTCDYCGCAVSPESPFCQSDGFIVCSRECQRSLIG